MFGHAPHRPRAVAFDVIGTLFPLEPLRPLVTALGLPSAGLEGWFASGLRDAFALASVGDFAPFTDVLDAALDAVLAEQGLDPSRTQRKAALHALAELDARPGAAAAIEMLTAAGVPVLALTNGSAASTKKLLHRAALDGKVTHIVSVDEVRRSKPAAAVYHRAAEAAGVAPDALALVAAHPWDINGAKAAGLVTAYLSADRPFSPVMSKPDLEAATLTECAAGLLALEADGAS